MKRYARAALCGTGHIGGSLLLALKRAGIVERAVGYDRDPAAAARAVERGIVDERAASAIAAATGADLIVLAVPVAAMVEVAAQIAPAVAPGCLVTDVGSVKGKVVAAVEAALADPSWFVGAHPIAGREQSGPDAADPDLLRGRLCLLTPTERSAPAAVVACAALWQSAGMRTRAFDPARHDRVLARVSHLPHVAAFALAAALDGAVEEGATDEAADLAGDSLRDTTRVAASDATMWRDVLMANREQLLPLVDALSDELTALRRAISDGDSAALTRSIERAHRGRRRLVRP